MQTYCELSISPVCSVPSRAMPPPSPLSRPMSTRTPPIAQLESGGLVFRRSDTDGEGTAPTTAAIAVAAIAVAAAAVVFARRHAEEQRGADGQAN